MNDDDDDDVYHSFSSPFIPSMRECLISITGFSTTTTPTRDELKIAIDTVGACYIGPLCKDYTTHLICGEEETYDGDDDDR